MIKSALKKTFLTILIFFSAFSLAQAQKVGDTVGVRFVCKDAAVAANIALADQTKGSEAASVAAKLALENGDCIVLPGPYPTEIKSIVQRIKKLAVIEFDANGQSFYAIGPITDSEASN